MQYNGWIVSYQTRCDCLSGNRTFQSLDECFEFIARDKRKWKSYLFGILKPISCGMSQILRVPGTNSYSPPER